MKKKFGFAYLFPILVVTAMMSRFTETWFVYLLDFIKVFFGNFLILGVAYALGDALDNKIGEKYTLGVILTIVITILVFVFSVAYKQ